MTIRFRTIACLLAAAAATVGLASCETAPPPAPIVAYVPPPPAPLPNVALSSTVVDHAAVFQGYMQRVSATRSDFQTVNQVPERIAVAQAFDPPQLQRGIVAYGAVAALQDATFVATIREFGRDPVQRAELVRRLIADPGYAASFNGSASAAGLVSGALNAQASTLLGVGDRVKQAAYDVQRQRPFLAEIPARPARLLAARAASVPLTADPAISEPLRLAAVGVQPLGLSGESLPPPYTPTVARALAVAALAALGEADGANAAAVEALLTEPSAAACLNLSKLYFYQCLAAAKPYYEDVFCLGQHILIDTAQCVGRSTGRPLAPAAPPALTTATNLTPVPQPAVAAAVGGAPPSVASQAAPMRPSSTAPAPPVSIPAVPASSDGPIPAGPR